MFINGLNQDLSLPVKRTRMDQETVSTPDLVNPANESICTLDESSQKKIVKILNL